MVLGGGGHVVDVGPALGLGIVLAGASGHGVGVHVDGVDGVADRYLVVHVEQVADVTGVALGAVRDKHLVDGEVDAAGFVVVLDDGLAQEVIALLGAVAVEGLGAREVVNGGVHGSDDRRGQRAGHVSDAHLDELGIWVLLLVGSGLVGDIREEVASRQLGVVQIDLSHAGSFLLVQHWLLLYLRLGLVQPKDLAVRA